MSNEANCANPECGHPEQDHKLGSYCRGGDFCGCQSYVAPQQPIQTEFCPNSCIFPLGHDGDCKMGFDTEPSLEEVIAAVRARVPNAESHGEIFDGDPCNPSAPGTFLGNDWRDALARLEAVEPTLEDMRRTLQSQSKYPVKFDNGWAVIHRPFEPDNVGAERVGFGDTEEAACRDALKMEAVEGEAKPQKKHRTWAEVKADRSVATPTAPPEVAYPTLYYPASTEDWRAPYDGKGMYFAAEVDTYIYSIEAVHAQTNAALAEANASNERLTDLVRYQRHELHDAKLISDQEFADLVADSDKGQRVARLEGYDAALAKIAATEGSK